MTEHGCAWGLTKAECYACQTEKEKVVTDIAETLHILSDVGTNLNVSQTAAVCEARNEILSLRAKLSKAEFALSDIDDLRRNEGDVTTFVRGVEDIIDNHYGRKS